MFCPDNTLIFAHRGANRQAAENTRVAFDAALLLPVDGIETDVQLSKDNVAVLWHDQYTDKLGYPGRRIDDFDFSELEAMNFAAHFNPELYVEGVLSLEEFVATYRGRCRLQIEIKNRSWEALERHRFKVEQTLALVGAANDMDVFLSSFNLQSMVYANRLNSQIPLFYAFDMKCSVADVEAILESNDFLAGLCLPIHILNQAIMQAIRIRHKTVLVYTCNRHSEILKALNLGVDVLITDDIQQALAMRQACSEHSPV